jgi:hypothetical protein
MPATGRFASGPSRICIRRFRTTKGVAAAGSLAHRGGDAHLGGGRTAAERREAAGASRFVAVVAWPGGNGAGPGARLALLRQAFRPGAHLSLSQAEHGMEHASGPSPRSGRPVDVVGGGRFHPAEASAGVCSGPEATLGASLRHRPPDTGSSPPRRFGAFGARWHARQAAETLRQIARQAQRQPQWPSQTLPSTQEDRLRARRQQARSFAMDIKLIAKLLVVKTQA